MAIDDAESQGFEPGGSGFRHGCQDYVGFVGFEVVLTGQDSLEISDGEPAALVLAQHAAIPVSASWKGMEEFFMFVLCHVSLCED